MGVQTINPEYQNKPIQIPKTKPTKTTKYITEKTQKRKEKKRSFIGDTQRKKIVPMKQ